MVSSHEEYLARKRVTAEKAVVGRELLRRDVVAREADVKLGLSRELGRLRGS